MTRPMVPYSESSRLLFAVPVARLASRLSALMQTEVLNPYGIKTAEWRILFNLVITGDSHLRQLARQANTDASYMSRLLSGLEKQGLVRRFSDEVDARRIRFAVTDEGFRVFDEIWPKASAISDEFRALFSDEENRLIQDALIRAVDYANARLKGGA